jgi:hypothetical protein
VLRAVIAGLTLLYAGVWTLLTTLFQNNVTRSRGRSVVERRRQSKNPTDQCQAAEQKMTLRKMRSLGRDAFVDEAELLDWFGTKFAAQSEYHGVFIASTVSLTLSGRRWIDCGVRARWCGLHSVAVSLIHIQNGFDAEFEAGDLVKGINEEFFMSFER